MKPFSYIMRVFSVDVSNKDEDGLERYQLFFFYNNAKKYIEKEAAESGEVIHEKYSDWTSKYYIVGSRKFRIVRRKVL